MKRYLLFQGHAYEAAEGGWNHYSASYDSVEEAHSAVDESNDWWHIVDIEVGEMIERSE